MGEDQVVQNEIVEGSSETEVKDVKSEEIKVVREEMQDSRFPVGDFVDFNTATAKQIVDWLLDNQAGVSPTNVLRMWTFASFPCKICKRKPEEVAQPGEPLYVVSFKSINSNPGRGIRFFCSEHAQLIQDELVSRGIEITTTEQKHELMNKLNYEFASEEDE